MWFIEGGARVKGDTPIEEEKQSEQHESLSFFS